MGYACPVCETPHPDAEHLANHLAFTAMLHGDDHERWLDDHVPDWAAVGPDELAPTVADHAPETPHETVFEDTTDAARPFEGESALGAASADPPRDDDAAAALATAREMTRAMLAGDEGGGDDTDEDDADEKA
jgi:hypothetical protein